MLAAHPRVSTSSLRHLCAQSIASLAFRRLLTSENVPHNLLAFAPLTNPHLYQITIGGRRLHILNNLILNRNLIRKYRQSRRSLLQMDLSAAKLRRIWPDPSPGDLLAVSVMMASVCHSYSETMQRMEAQDRVLAVAVPPPLIWRQQRPWRSLGRLVLSNLSPDRIELEINGLEADRRPFVKRVTIAAKQQVEVSPDLFNLLCVCTERIPASTPRVESSTRKAKWLITPSTWSNLWFYNPQLLLAGWLTSADCDQVYQSASRGPPVRKTNRKDHLRTALQIQDLRPIRELFHRIRHM
jgi:hypothetical protein